MPRPSGANVLGTAIAGTLSRVTNKPCQGIPDMPHSTYLPHRMGSATIDPTGRFEAGSFQSFALTYTAGYFGIDDTGSIKIVHRFASDMGKPQFDNPSAPNYVTAEASNGAVLDVRYDGKMNIRPWDKTLYIKVVRGFLREGDRIVVRFGDPRQGSPGMRMQTPPANSSPSRVTRRSSTCAATRATTSRLRRRSGIT